MLRRSWAFQKTEYTQARTKQSLLTLVVKRQHTDDKNVYSRFMSIYDVVKRNSLSLTINLK